MSSGPAGDAEFLDRARAIRRHVVRQAAGKGEGYVGQGLQCADVLATLFFREMRWRPDRLEDPSSDRFLLSVGHYAIALYAVLVEAGILAEEQLDSYGSDGSPLTLGAEPGEVPGIEFAGGSLGQGLGVGVGLAWALRRLESASRVFVYMSDGELQEGSTWEAAMLASHLGMDGLVTIVDLNRTQADGPLVVNVDPVVEKFQAFGWWAVDVDGHDLEALAQAFEGARSRDARPKVLVCHTEIGHGSETVRSRRRSHFVRVPPDQWEQVRREVEQA